MGEKPTAAFVLSLVGGAFLGLVAFALMSLMETYVIFGIYELVLAGVIIVGAAMMYTNPTSARKWGIVIVVASVIAGLNLLALGGGIAAMRWKARLVCGNCGAKTTAPSSFCSQCGASLRPTPTQAVQAKVQVPTAASTRPSPGKKYCTNCGAEIHEGAQFCPACGNRQLATP